VESNFSCNRAVFLGNYSQHTQDVAYNKFKEMENAGISLVVIGGVLVIAILIGVIIKCMRSPY
jgi:hypothetical protein